MAKFKRISIDLVPVGSVLKAPIGDPSNPQIKLLAEGVGVSQAFIDKLKSRGIGEVVISTRDIALLKAFEPQGRAKKVPPTPSYVQSVCVNDASKDIDKAVHGGAELTVGEIEDPFSSTISKPKNCGYNDGLPQQWAEDSDEQIEVLIEIFDETCGGEVSATAASLREQCEDILDRVQEDQDALVCQAASPYSSEYPSRHALHLTSMAMAIGIEIGLDHANLIDLGIGCLIHDIGMKQIGLEQFDEKSTISPKGLQTLADHPVASVGILGQVGEEISVNSRLVAYQLHERLDGSGYPRGRKGNHIHDLAKIAAVADAFVGMVSPRPHRLGIQGYFAIKQILDEMKQGKFDPKVVRALLHATSLYPLGSFVELTNEHIGRVIRSAGPSFDQPTIEMWPANQLDSKPAIVDLTEEPSIQIAGSIAAPKAAA